jgi:SAM-dependent methyltransferase
MSMTGVDFGKTAGDYAKHRAGFPDVFFDRLIPRIGAPRLLDLGTGTGTLARGFARRGFKVTALDRSRALLDEAARLAAEESVELAQVEARAEQTGLADGSFEVVTAGQCWHWFDGHQAARETFRLLVPGGAVVLAYFDWVGVAGNLVDRTCALIEQHNPAWTLRNLDSSAGLSMWMSQLRAAGFADVEWFGFDVAVRYTHEAWRGRVRASAGIGASLPPEKVAAFDAALGALLAADFPSDPLSVPHLVFALIARRPER